MATTRRQIAENIQRLTNDDLAFLNKRDKTGYLYKPPSIKPNYGKQSRYKGVLPKTKISRVLLFDNSMQDQMLDVRCNYIDRQKKRVTQIFKKSKHAFQDKLSIRRKWHESWDTRYTHMKKDFITKYGTRYMPIPTPDGEKIDPFLLNARIAPPLNILVFYLAGQKEAMQKRTLDIANTKEKINDIIDQFKSKNDVYSRSIEDPRFRILQQTLADPGFKTDGYLQLSPNYAHDPNDKKWKPAKRELIALPKFYLRLKADSQCYDVPRKSPAIKNESTLHEGSCEKYSLPALPVGNIRDVKV